MTDYLRSNGIDANGFLNREHMLETLRCVFELVPDALIVWNPSTRSVYLANRTARETRLVDGYGRVAEHLAHATAELRNPNPQNTSGVVRSEGWMISRSGLGPSMELISCSPAPMQEMELVRAFQRTYKITDRQADVLRQLLRGKTTREVAAALSISQITVRRHQSALLAAVSVSNKMQLFRLAEELQAKCTARDRKAG